MTALVMQKLADVLAKEGFIVKKIEDEEINSFNRSDDGVKYTGEIIIRVRPVDDEESEKEIVKFRKEKNRGQNPETKQEAVF